METVTIDGVDYVKASALAKKHRYTSDYIGQLCRSKKVDARLVGRTWYVYPPSLENHKETRYADLRQSENLNKGTIKSKSSRIDVQPHLMKTALKEKKPHFHNRVMWRPATYEPDNAELVPNTSTKANNTVVKMPVTLAEGQSLRVAAVSKNVTMVSEPLPAIALSGTLKIQDFTPNFIAADPAPKQEYQDNASDIGTSIAPTAIGHTESAISNEQVSTDLHYQNPDATSHHESFAVEPISPVSAGTKTVSGTTTPRASKQSTSLQSSRHPIRGLSHHPEERQPSLVLRLVIAPAVVLLVLSVAASLVLVENVTVTAGGEQVASLRFNLSFVDALWR